MEGRTEDQQDSIVKEIQSVIWMLKGGKKRGQAYFPGTKISFVFGIIFSKIIIESVN